MLLDARTPNTADPALHAVFPLLPLFPVNEESHVCSLYIRFSVHPKTQSCRELYNKRQFKELV